MSTPSVSVIVPTRDRPAALARCLAALERQTLDAFEIVVVDDASTDADAVTATVAAITRARILHGAGRGPAAARNAGASAARAPVVCFTDDDCEPATRWLEQLTAPIAAGADAAAGPTRNARHGSATARAAQTIASYLSEASLRAGGRLGFAPTSNLACRTDLLRAVPFDERYPLAAGEDRDWCARLQQCGASLVFAPGAVVDHHQDLTLAAFWRQSLRYGRGAYRFHRAGPAPARFERPHFYAALLRRAFAQGPATGALVCAAQVATAGGMAAEALSARRAGA